MGAWPLLATLSFSFSFSLWPWLCNKQFGGAIPACSLSAKWKKKKKKMCGHGFPTETNLVIIISVCAALLCTLMCTELRIYKAFIQPQITYCHIAWHHCRSSDDRKVERLQQGALQVIYCDTRSSCEEFFKNANF